MRSLMHKPAPPAERPALLLWGIALASFGAVGAALVSQYQFDMQPCAFCTLQRLVFLLIGAVALIGALVPAAGLRRLVARLALLLALCGVASALWQHFIAAANASCNLTWADRIMSGLGLYDAAPAIFAPMASCADAAVNLVGVPYAFWSVAVFVVCGLLGLRVAKLARG